MPAEVPDILRRIEEQRRRALGPAPSAVTGGTPAAPLRDNAFLEALRTCRGRAVIAEVKLGSPSLGDLSARVDPERQARCYRQAGAAALSVVVEPDFFHGSYELLARCRTASGLPALAKDFVVDERQLEWAKRAGADAVLLIAALYGPAELRRWATRARRLGLVPLVETHDATDVAKLDGAEWELVGINNRDLRTFEVDLERSAALVPSLPAGCLRVAESGLEQAQQLARLSRAGFDAFLIGETLLLASDAEETLRSLLRGWDK